MKNLSFKALALAGLMGAMGLSGCVSGGDPNQFVVDMNDGRMTGTYDPSGFTSKDIQHIVGADCPGGKLGSYGETPLKSGKVSFSATCK